MAGGSFRRLVAPRILPWLCWIQIAASVVVAVILIFFHNPLVGVPLLLFLPILTRVHYEFLSIVFEMRHDLRTVTERFPNAVQLLREVSSALPGIQARLDDLAPNAEGALRSLNRMSEGLDRNLAEMLQAGKRIAACFPATDVDTASTEGATLATVSGSLVGDIVDLVEGRPAGPAGENAKPIVQDVLNAIQKAPRFQQAGARRV